MKRVVASALLLMATSAAAHGVPDMEQFLSVGGLGSASSTLSGASTFGAGLELTYGRYLDEPNETVAIGGFAQAQYLAGGGFEFAAGIQPSALLLGLELGAAVRTGVGGAPVETRLHVAPFVSILGVTSLALRVQVPLGTTRDLLIGAALTLKLPFYEAHNGWRTLTQ